MNEIITGDCLEVMRGFATESVDLICTSPPYDNIEASGYSRQRRDVLFLKLYSDFLNTIFKECHRVLNPRGQFYFNIKHATSNNQLRTCHWVEFLEGFQLFQLKSYIIWKYAGSFDSSTNRYHLDYETIYHLAKSDQIEINSDCGEKDPLTSVWYIPHSIPLNERVHPAQMPQLLAERIIGQGSKKGDLVLDPFAGSGTTGVVCKILGRQHIGIEINPEYAEIARARIKLHQEQMKLSEA